MSKGEQVAEALGLVSEKFICDICGMDHDSQQEALKCVLECAS